MAALSPLRFSAAWRVEAPFSAVSRFDGFYTLCSLWLAAYSCMMQHLAPGKDILMNVGARYHVVPLLQCLWLQRSQSILVQEIRPAKDINLTCFKTFPIKATTCLQVGPMSLDWPVDPFARFDQSRPSSSPEESSDEQQQSALPASTRSRWRQGCSSTNLKYNRVLQVGIRAAISLTEVCDVLLGTLGVSLDVFSSQKKRELKLNVSGSSLTTTTCYVSSS